MTSELLQYLPAIYQEGAWNQDDSAAPPFLNNFLLAFERILLERPAARKPEADDLIPLGLEEQIARLYTLFHPHETPARFLDWLAAWASLQLPTDLPEARKRILIARIIPLYSIRGTKKYLEELLELYLDVPAKVAEADRSDLQIGKQSTVGVDTYIGGGPPYFFRVTLSTSGEQHVAMDQQLQLAHAVIELAKPAHTTYHLSAIHPRMQIAVHSTVGVDTFLTDN
jgi:phage tail-like protein